jgi:hypothetical protein
LETATAFDSAFVMAKPIATSGPTDLFSTHWSVAVTEELRAALADRARPGSSATPLARPVRPTGLAVEGGRAPPAGKTGRSAVAPRARSQ